MKYILGSLIVFDRRPNGTLKLAKTIRGAHHIGFDSPAYITCLSIHKGPGHLLSSAVNGETKAWDPQSGSILYCF